MRKTRWCQNKLGVGTTW